MRHPDTAYGIRKVSNIKMTSMVSAASTCAVRHTERHTAYGSGKKIATCSDFAAAGRAAKLRSKEISLIVTTFLCKSLESPQPHLVYMSGQGFLTKFNISCLVRMKKLLSVVLYLLFNKNQFQKA